MTDQTTINFVLDSPNEAAAELKRMRGLITELCAALSSYVDDANSYVTKGRPGSPFALRLKAGEAALAKAGKLTTCN